MGDLKGRIKETTGAAEEELGEALNNEKMAEDGRKTRNEGLMEQGKAPKTNPVGSEKP